MDEMVGDSRPKGVLEDLHNREDLEEVVFGKVFVWMMFM